MGTGGDHACRADLGHCSVSLTTAAIALAVMVQVIPLWRNDGLKLETASQQSSVPRIVLEIDLDGYLLGIWMVGGIMSCSVTIVDVVQC